MHTHTVFLRISVALFLLFTLYKTSHSQQIIINEVMASNSEFYSDEDGSFEDWIELYNYGNEPVNLQGFGLSDNYDEPFKWVFPAYHLQPGEYLLVWASGKDRIPQGNGLFNGIKRRFYPGIPGTDVASLVNHHTFPHHPASRNIISNFFEAPTDIDDNYGQHLFTWIVPPQTGNYIFTIASDDNSHLYLSSGADPDNTQLIAQVPGWTMPREWNKFTEQTSAPVFLQQGELYYLSALMKEGYGGDNLAVRWQWPDGTVDEPISAQHCFLTGAMMHTNFKISSSGEEIILTHPNGTRIDEMPPVEIPTNISYGRVPGNTIDWVYFDQPTPGEQNHHQGYNCISSTPFITPATGIYNHQVTAEIFTDDPEAQIKYTTNGTLPGIDHGHVYQGPITIHNSTYLRAISIAPGCLPGMPAGVTYTRPNPQLADFSSDLPVMIIQSFTQNVTPGNRSPAYMILKEPQENGRVNWDDPHAFDGRIKINIRGSSSQMFPKKGYGFHILDEREGNLKVSLLDMPEDHNWVLHGPYSDKSLMRNAVSYAIGEDAGHYSPRTRFIELFLQESSSQLQSAHYRGVYVLTERIKIAPGRVEIEELEPYYNVYPEVSGGYIFSIDRLNDGETGFLTQRNSLFRNVRPNEFNISTAQRDYLISYVDSLETALFGNDFTDPQLGYQQYMDVRSFIDMHLITEVTKEIDGYRLSTFFTKDRQGKVKSGPLWDFNLALGNANYLGGWNPQGWYYSLLSEQDYMYGWYNRLFQDPWFEEQYKRRYRILRMNAFSEVHLTGKIHHNSNLLREAQVRNFNRWNILGEWIWPNWFVADSFEEEIEWMTNWLRQRLQWMDGELGEPLTMIHYWNFNDTGQLLEPSYTIYDAGLASNTAGSAEMTSGTGQGFSGLNARNGDEAGTHLRINNPIGASLLFELPTTGYKEVVFSYETRRSGSGANRQYISYTIDGENFIPFDTLAIVGKPELKIADFINVSEANDNPLFGVKISFGYDETEDGGEAGNNRIDNVSLDGEALEETIRPPLQVSVLPEHLELIENQASHNIAMGYYFKHPDGEPLQYTIDNHHPEIADVSLQNNNIVIEPVKRGGGMVHFQVSDGVNPPLERSFYLLVHPEAVPLAQESFVFDFWSPDEPEGSFPDNMIFLQGESDDATLATAMMHAYFIPHDDYASQDEDNIGYPYRNERRTRINGLNASGVSFINTGRGRDLGAAVLALDTRDLDQINISWQASTIIPNSRAYAIRLQYRTSLQSHWKDLKDAEGAVIEYTRGSFPYHTQAFEKLPLPSEAIGQPYVQLRWLYYHTGVQLDPNVGARDMLALNFISLGDATSVTQLSVDNPLALVAFPNPAGGETVFFNKKVSGTLYDLHGKRVRDIQHTSSLSIAGLKSGVYVFRSAEGEVVRLIVGRN